jgi:hypothetical protein
MVKGKNAQHIVLNENQMRNLITCSIRNIVSLDIQAGEKVYNNFLVLLILDCVIPEAFPQHSIKDIDEQDYDKDAFYESHLVEPLQPFGVSLLRVNDKDTQEKFWGLEIVINQKNVADFIQALAEVEDEWSESDNDEEEIKEPSKTSVRFDGNETLN